MFERFTAQARQVVVLADAEARRRYHSQVSTEHLLLGLLGEGGNVATKVLVSLGVPLEAVRVDVQERIGWGQTEPLGELLLTPAAKQVLEWSSQEAAQLQQQYVGPEHLLLSLVGERTSIAAQVLAGLGADPIGVRAQLLELLAGGRPEPAARARPNGQPVPADRRELAEQPVQGWLAPSAVVDAAGVDTAAALVDRGVQFPVGPAERDPAGVDVQAVLAQNQWLRGEVERLRDLLGQYGIDPDSGTAQAP